MTLPSSGALSINQIRTEMNTTSGSLRTLSSLAGFSTPDKISDFYGFSNYYKPNLICYTDPYVTTNYSPNITSCTIYSTYNGGTRAAGFYIQYSDDNNNWYNSWYGVMSNNGQCGVITVTGGGAVGSHRYWRFYEAGAVIGHFPRTARITLGDNLGRSWTIARYVYDNCADIGNYQPYIISYDFANSIPDLTSVSNGTSCRFNGISYNGGGYLNMPGNGGNYGDYGNFTGMPTYGSFQFWFYSYSVSNYRNYFCTNNNQGNTGIRFEQYSDGTSQATIGDGGSYSTHYLGTISANTWYNIALTWNRTNNNVKIYKNNVLVSNTSNNYYWPEALNAWASGIGYNFDGNRNLYGAFGPLLVYNTELTANQVQQNWITWKSRYGY